MEHKGIQLLALCLAVFISVGHARAPSKIVNGQAAYSAEFTHQVSLQIWKQHFCGGSILDSTHILTAAHCVLDKNGQTLRGIEVVTGTNDKQHRTSENVFPVQRITYHQGYDPNEAWKNDVAVLKLSRPISFNSYQKPINLPTSDVPVGAHVVASGWGALQYAEIDAPSPRYLQKLGLTTLSHESCQRYLGSRINPGQVCVLAGEGRGVCVGDSGGPITYNGQVVGLASWVVPCAQGYPDVFTRVYQYVPWIKQVLSYY